MLYTQHNTPFTTGSIKYLYEAIPPDTRNLRVILSIWIEGVETTAVIDTGAPYLVVHPRIAMMIGLSPLIAEDVIKLEVRGVKYRGGLHRLKVGFFAEEGENVSFEATAFVPEVSHDTWSEQGLPTFLGIGQCLDRIRFAFDPGDDRFYFGNL
jgi:hypothetical protein